MDQLSERRLQTAAPARAGAWGTRPSPARVTGTGRDGTLPGWIVGGLLLGLHVPLGLLVHRSAVLATIYGVAILLVGAVAMIAARPVTLLCVAAYAASAEVLWRMSDGRAPWESAKYEVLLLAIAGLVRSRDAFRMRLLPFVFLVALLPSLLVPASDGTYTTREFMIMFGFNLVPPLALGAAAWYASVLSLTRAEFQRVLFVGLAPVLGIAAVTVFTTYSTAQLAFTEESNFATSGGYGPNQVSVVLGLGVLYCLPRLLDASAPKLERGALGAVAMLCLTQSVMTFSRGGLYSLGAAVIAATPFMLRARATRRAFTVGIVVIAALFAAVVLPRLNAFTGGALDARFSETTSSHRDEIMAEDWRLWGEHPILGLGPGGAYRERRTDSKVAHTEYTRLLSEHGTFGAIAVLALLGMALTALLQMQNAPERGLRALWLTWVLFSMGHVGMRVAVLPFVFALGQLRGYDAPPAEATDVTPDPRAG